MKTFEYKRALLYRKAQGNVHKVNYFNKIHLLTGCIVDQEQLLTLEETDGIIQSLKKKKNDLKKPYKPMITNKSFLLLKKKQAT